MELKPFTATRKKNPSVTVQFNVEMIKLNTDLVEVLDLKAGERVNFYPLDGIYLLGKSDTGYKLIKCSDGRLWIRCRTFIRHLADFLGIIEKAKRSPYRYTSRSYVTKLTNITVGGNKTVEIILGR